MEDRPGRGVEIVVADDLHAAARTRAVERGAAVVAGGDEAVQWLSARLALADARERRRVLDEAVRLSDDLSGSDSIADERLLAEAVHVRLAARLPEDFGARVARAREVAAAVETARAAADTEAKRASINRRRLRALAPGHARDVDPDEVRAAAQAFLETEEGAVGAHQRPARATAVAGSPRRKPRWDRSPDVLRARAVLAEARGQVRLLEVGMGVAGVTACVPVVMAVGGVVGWLPALFLSLAPMAPMVELALRRRARLLPARSGLAQARRRATGAEGAGDSPVDTDEALRRARERWQALVGPEAQPDDAERLAGLFETERRVRAALGRAEAELVRRQAQWEGVAAGLLLPIEEGTPAREAIEYLERLLVLRAAGPALLEEVARAERRAARRSRLAELLAGRTLSQLRAETDLLAGRGTSETALRPVVILDDPAIEPADARSLAPLLEQFSGRTTVTVVTDDVGRWAWARAGADVGGTVIDLRSHRGDDTQVTPDADRGAGTTVDRSRRRNGPGTSRSDAEDPRWPRRRAR